MSDGFKAAMVEVMAKGNVPNEKFYKVYKTWAEGGFGLILTGNVQVDARMLGTPLDVAVHDTDFEGPGFEKWLKYAESCKGTPTVVQLCHTGRQSGRGSGRGLLEPSIGPSALALQHDAGFVERTINRVMFGTPKEMTKEDIDTVVGQFVRGAKLAHKAGFQGVQLHGAHGYLLSAFMNPKSNRRTDEYGGSSQNRIRLTLRIFEEIRKVIPLPFSLSIKMNSADFQKGGLTPEDVLDMVRAIAYHPAKVDFIEISGGDYESPAMMGGQKHQRQSTKMREAYFVEFAKKIREVIPAKQGETALMVTGGFSSRSVMKEAVTTGACDLIGIGRPATLDFHLPKNLILNDAIPDSKAVATRVDISGLPIWKYIPAGAVGAGGETIYHAWQMRQIGYGKQPDPTKTMGQVISNMMSGVVSALLRSLGLGIIGIVLAIFAYRKAKAE